jgi:hypothetical protein
MIVRDGGELAEVLLVGDGKLVVLVLVVLGVMVLVLEASFYQLDVPLTVFFVDRVCVFDFPSSPLIDVPSFTFIADHARSLVRPLSSIAASLCIPSTS